MDRYIKAALWAIPPILFLVIVPRFLLGLIPQADINTLSQHTSIDLPTFVTGLNILGIVIAVLSAVQTWAYKWSIIKPVSSSLHMIASFLLMLYFIGLGNIGSFGVTNLTVTGSGSSGTNFAFTLNLTLTFLAIMVGVAVALKIIQKTMKYVEDRRNHLLDLEAQARGPPTPPTGAPPVKVPIPPSP